MTISLTYPVTDAAGIAETVLPPQLLDRLPDSVAPAPWRVRCEVASWLHEVDQSARAVFPDAIRPERIGLVAWALVRYTDTPVGPYSELAATLIPDGDARGHIPFIVVDSLASIVGGRVNWLLPKAFASFTWDADQPATRSVIAHSLEPATPAWQATVAVMASGEPSPITVPNQLRQVSTDGVVRAFDGELSGSAAAATITVSAAADGPLAALLIPGTYDGTLITDGDFAVGALTG